MRRGMSRQQQISSRPYHCCQEPPNESDPLFSYNNAHLKETSTWMYLLWKFVLWEPSTCSGVLLSERVQTLYHKDGIARKPHLWGIVPVSCTTHPEVIEKGTSQPLCPSGEAPALFDLHFAHLSWRTEGSRQKTVLDGPISHRSGLGLH